MVLNGRVMNTVTQLPLSLIIVFGWFTVAYMAFKFFTPGMPPGWHRYLWPLALPLCGISLGFGNRQGEPKGDINFDAWVVLCIYTISTIAIAVQVRGMVRFAKNQGGNFTRNQYREALRTARALLWVMPLFFLVALVSEYVFGSDKTIAEEFLNSVRGQVFGVIGAASAIAAFTAVPSEAKAFRGDYYDKIQHDTLIVEINNIRTEVDSLRNGISAINDELHQIRVEKMDNSRWSMPGSFLRALVASASLRMSRGRP